MIRLGVVFCFLFPQFVIVVSVCFTAGIHGQLVVVWRIIHSGIRNNLLATGGLHFKLIFTVQRRYRYFNDMIMTY